MKKIKKRLFNKTQHKLYYSSLYDPHNSIWKKFMKLYLHIHRRFSECTDLYHALYHSISPKIHNLIFFKDGLNLVPLHSKWKKIPPKMGIIVQ